MKTNDQDVDPDARFSITGVPFTPGAPLKKRTIKYLEPKIPKQAKMGQKRKLRDPLAPNTRFTLARVLRFFPRDPTDSFYIMHCGCVLEHALLDFYKYKGLTIKSDGTHQSEPYARMAKTRDRLGEYTLFTRFGLSVADLFTQDVDGFKITEIDRLQRLSGRLNVMIDKMYAEEYAASRRELKRQADAAKEKFKSRAFAYVDMESEDEAGSSIFGESDDNKAGPSTIPRRPLPFDDSSDESEEESEDDGEDGDSDEDADGSTDEDEEEGAQSDVN